MSLSLFNNPVWPRLYDIVVWPFATASSTLTIDELRDLPSSARVLEVGAGTGLVAGRLRRELSVEVEAIEPAAAMRAVALAAYPDLRIEEGRAEAIPAADQTYDVVVYSSVFRYIRVEDLDQVLQEAARVTRPDGRVIINDLNLPGIGGGASTGPNVRILGPWSLYSPKDLAAYAGGFGLRLERIEWPLFSFWILFRRV